MALKSAVLVAACALLVGGLPGARSDTGVMVQPWPAWRDPLYVTPGIAVPFNPYYGYYWYGPCYPFASCVAYLEYRLMQRRIERFDELGRPPAAPGRSHYPLPEGAPAPEAELQPQYRDSGKVLPQHQHTGEWLHENSPQQP